MMQAASDEVRSRPRRVRTRIVLERKWWTLVVVCIAIFMLLLDITIVNVALPPISRSLNAGFTDLQWVIDAYALALATCVLNAGSLADLLGRKRVFVAGVVLFTAASALCGAASTPLFLILARDTQGIGGAIIPALGAVLALSLVRRRDFAASSAPAQA
jgi:MFS family permease